MLQQHSPRRAMLTAAFLIAAAAICGFLLAANLTNNDGTKDEIAGAIACIIGLLVIFTLAILEAGIAAHHSRVHQARLELADKILAIYTTPTKLQPGKITAARIDDPRDFGADEIFRTTSEVAHLDTPITARDIKAGRINADPIDPHQDARG